MRTLLKKTAPVAFGAGLVQFLVVVALNLSWHHYSLNDSIFYSFESALGSSVAFYVFFYWILRRRLRKTVLNLRPRTGDVE
jgi:hypothetical protein